MQNLNYYLYVVKWGQFEKGILRQVHIDKFNFNQMLNNQSINDYMNQN